MNSKTIRIAGPPIISNVDGPGRRQVIHAVGCPIHCPGCQNQHLWDPKGGEEWRVDDLAAVLLDGGLPITISGGEPVMQADTVADLLTALRIQQPELHILIYSGFCIEDLLDIAPAIPSILDILNTADVLIDSPYIAALDHDRLQYRGSSNQRPINLHETTWYGTDVIDLVLEDWDTQTIVIDVDGDVIGTAGTMRELFDDTSPTRMCGEVGKADEHQAWARGCCDRVFGRRLNPYHTEPERLAWERGNTVIDRLG